MLLGSSISAGILQAAISMQRLFNCAIGETDLGSGVPDQRGAQRDDNVGCWRPRPGTIQGQHDRRPHQWPGSQVFLLFNPEPGWKLTAAPTSAIAPSATFLPLAARLARRCTKSRLQTEVPPTTELLPGPLQGPDGSKALTTPGSSTFNRAIPAVAIRQLPVGASVAPAASLKSGSEAAVVAYIDQSQATLRGFNDPGHASAKTKE